MEIIVGVIYFIGLLIIVIYSAVAVKHAIHFRFISRRTIYISLFYILSAIILTGLSLYAFFATDWN